MSSDGIKEKVKRIRLAYERLDDAQSNALAAASLVAAGKTPKWVKRADVVEDISSMAGYIAGRLKGAPAEAMSKAVVAALKHDSSVGHELAELSGPSGEAVFARASNAMLLGTYDALAELTGVSGEDGWRSGKVTEDGLEKIRDAVDKTFRTDMRSAGATASADVATGIDLYIGVAAHSLLETLGEILCFVSTVEGAKRASSDEDPQREKTLAEDRAAKARDDGPAKAENTPPIVDMNASADRKLPDISGIKGYDGNENDGLEL
jgi:hypothetical protein